MSTEATKFSAATAAKLLMVTERHLQRLAADGWISKPYTAVGCCQGYIRYLKDEARRGSKTAAGNRTADARAREIELRIAEKERTLISLPDAIASFDFVVGTLRSRIDGFAARFTRDRGERQRLQDDLDAVLQSAADAIITEAARLSKGGTP